MSASSSHAAVDIVKDVYRSQAATFFDELRAGFTKETNTLRKESQEQLKLHEFEHLKGLIERIEKLEANTVIHMPMSAGDAAAGAGTCTSTNSISQPSSDASTIRLLCHEEAQRAIKELRAELLGPAARRESVLSAQVAEVRDSVAGAAAMASAVATAEVGRLDGAFRSSLAAEVRDLGSLCEGVRRRIEALDQSAAEHIGRLSTRLSELELRAEPSSSAPSYVSAAPSSDSARRSERAVGSGTAPPERPSHGDTCESAAVAASARSERFCGFDDNVETAARLRQPKARLSASVAAAEPVPIGSSVSRCSSKESCHMGSRSGSKESCYKEARSASKDYCYGNPCKSLCSSSGGKCRDAGLGLAAEEALEQAHPIASRPTVQAQQALLSFRDEAASIMGSQMPPETASTSAPASGRFCPPTSGDPAQALTASGRFGPPISGDPSQARSPSTPPKRHGGPGSAAGYRPQSPDGCSSSNAAANSSVPASCRTSKCGGKTAQWEWGSPARHEVRGGC